MLTMGQDASGGTASPFFIASVCCLINWNTRRPFQPGST